VSYLIYLTLLPPVILGTLLVSWLLLPTRKGNILLFVSLGIPVGFGVVACLFFLWSCIFNPSNPGFFVVEFALIAFLFFLNWKRREYLNSIIPDLKAVSKLEWIIGGLFVIVVLIGLISFSDYTNANPHGRYDAWAIWNVRARMLARAGENWKTVFIPQVFHADYPLLVPTSIAHSWLMAGTESQRIPPVVAGLFTFGTAGILSGALLTLKKKEIAWVAGILFLSTPWVIYFGSLQFADLPLACCMLGATACLSVGMLDRPKSGPWLTIAALSAGMAAWAKNEGQLFLVIFIAISVLSILIMCRNDRPVRLSGWLLVGLVLPLIVILLFKFTLAPANDVVDTGNLSSTFALLLSPARYAEVIAGYKAYPKGFGGWTVPLSIVFLFAWLLMKPKINGENKVAFFSLAAILILQWIGYFLIYVITPHQLQTHINQSYDRLLMHMYPSFILLLFLVISPLKEILSSSTNKVRSPAV
jgi:hypothetical protein